MTIFALSWTTFAEDQTLDCGVTSQVELKLQAQSQLNVFTEAKSFDRWIYLQAYQLSNGQIFDPKAADKKFPKWERSLKADWTQALKAIPDLKLFDTILNELQSLPALQGRPTYLPSVRVEMIGGCDSFCILNGEAFIFFVNPDFLSLLKASGPKGKILPGSPAHRSIKFIVAHELSHAIHSYAYIAKERLNDRWALPTELQQQKGEDYLREHLIVDAIAALLTDTPYHEAAQIIDQTRPLARRMGANDAERDLKFRSSCLKKLSEN